MPPAELLGNLSVDPVSAGVLPIWPVFRGPVLRDDTNLPNVRLSGGQGTVVGELGTSAPSLLFRWPDIRSISADMARVLQPRFRDHANPPDIWLSSG